ncbi:MAG: glucokinase [Burkholderiales bacterium]
MRLVADIGGTNLRIALVPEGSLEPQQEKTLHCADFDGLEAAVRLYLRECGDPAVGEVAVDVACDAITGDFINLTNGPWGFSIKHTCANLGFTRLQVVNDFSALALAVPQLRADELRRIGGGEAVKGTPIAVIGAGTGLGVSGLIPVNSRWVALDSRGGHTAFSPMSEREIGVLRYLRREFDHVSTERVLSGMGLENLYRCLCALDNTPARVLGAEQITAAASSAADPHCREAVDMFCAILGTAAANLVITLGASGGCYIGGGIVPKLGDYFAHAPFRARFENKGRFSDYLAAVPTHVILAPAPALRGLATLLDPVG